MIRMEIACFMVVFFLSIVYFSAKRERNALSKVFASFMGISLIHLIFDALTIYTVNHLQTIPLWINNAVHRLFFLTMLLLFYLLFCYIALLIEEETGRITPVPLWCSRVVMISFAGVLFLPIHYMQTPQGNYSYGPAVYAIYASISVNIFMSIRLFKRNWRDIHQKTKTAIGLAIAIFVAVSVYQMVKPLALISGMGIMLINLSLYLTMENPDILLVKQVEKEKIKSDEANKAKSVFLSNMSHEIRTPMNAIIGMTEILLRTNLSGEQKEYLVNIKRSGHALVSIINDILDISKIEAGKMELIEDVYEVRPMLDDIYMLIKTRIGEKPIDLIMEVGKDIPDFIYGDEGRIRQIIINLLNNAVKFTEKGYVKLALKLQQTEEDKLALSISVSDTGQGIRSEDINRLFKAFEQVDTKKNKGKEGTGLGLTISNQLISMMGGRLEVTSEYGKGSEFYFTIYQKTVSEDMVRKAEKKEYSMNFIAPNAEILLVDDNEINRKVAKGLLEPLQMNIDMAEDGKKAIYMLQKKKYDLVFMDHLMPVMDGVEATIELRKSENEYLKKVPVIALSANAMKDAQEQFINAGMNGFVAKPIEMKQICRVLREWLPEELIVEAENEETVQKTVAERREHNHENVRDMVTKETVSGQIFTEKKRNAVKEQPAKIEGQNGIQQCSEKEEKAKSSQKKIEMEKFLMDNNGKRFVTDRIMKAVSVFFGIALFVCTLYLVITSMVMPEEGNKPVVDCKVFETQWYQVLENGTQIPVVVPGKVEAQRGEIVTLVTTLPDNLEGNDSIFFRSSWQDVTIFIDGERRVHYDTKDSRLFGANSPTKYIPVELRAEDAGKELVYQFSTMSKYAGNIRQVYIGDDDGIWLFLLNASTGKVLISLGLLIAGMVVVIACAIVRFVYKKKLALRFLAWTISLCAIWMLSELDIRQMWLNNVSVVTAVSYWSLMLIPVAFLLYMDEVQKRRYRKIYTVAIVYCLGVFVIQTVLQIFDIIQFTDQLIYVHIGIGVTILCVGGTIAIDLFKKRIRDYLTVGIGIAGFLFLSVMELIWYYIQVNYSKGIFLAMGLLYLLVMAIIMTGQELFLSEKVKQQAISAKEAEEKFLANMSHEIRTPMNAIVGMTEILLRGKVSKEQKEYLENIKSSGNALVSIINDILDISKIEAGKMELVNDIYKTQQMISDIDKIIRTRIGDKPIELVCDIDSALPERLYGDSLRIRQIIINLANNAVKFTDRGRITITVRSKQTTDERVAVSVSVADTGQGIRPEDIKRLFGAFEQVNALKNKGKEGTGLGLTICSQLVEMMGGKLEVKSEYGRGSEFYFTIYQDPVSADMVWKQEAEDDIMHFVAPQARILIVDDNEVNHKVARGLLAPLKMQIDTAVNGKEALEKILQNRYDLVFMDHMMPVMDGVEATRRLREMEDEYCKNVPIVALTANAMKEAQNLFKDAGMNGFVAKPIIMKHICQAIREWLPKEQIQVLSEEQLLTEVGAEGVDDLSYEDNCLNNNVPEIDKNFNTEYSNIEGIDIAEGIKNLGSKEFLFELLGDYCSVIDSKALKIEKCLADERIKDYTIEVHSLKSSSRLIGALELSDEFRFLEDLGNAMNVEKIKEATPKVLQHYRMYKTFLASFATMQEREKKEVPKEEVLMYLKGIQEAIEGFDLDTADAAMEKLEECRLPEECIPLMEQLRPLLADVAMEDIIAVTDKMIAVIEEK